MNNRGAMKVVVVVYGAIAVALIVLGSIKWRQGKGGIMAMAVAAAVYFVFRAAMVARRLRE